MKQKIPKKSCFFLLKMSIPNYKIYSTRLEILTGPNITVISALEYEVSLLRSIHISGQLIGALREPTT